MRFRESDNEQGYKHDTERERERGERMRGRERERRAKERSWASSSWSLTKKFQFLRKQIGLFDYVFVPNEQVSKLRMRQVPSQRETERESEWAERGRDWDVDYVSFVKRPREQVLRASWEHFEGLGFDFKKQFSLLQIWFMWFLFANWQTCLV